jgi:sugar/nucleoside kinase (ribokinase family)
MKTILCYGAICADYELTVPRLPTAGTGVHVTAARWLAGGNALNEALALRSWGLRPQLWGDVLGCEPAAATVLAALQAAELTATVQTAADAVTPVCHVLVTPDGERTILALRAGTRALVPDDAALQAADIVSVARYGLQTLEVIARARALNRQVVVGDVRSADDPAAAAADVIVTSAAELGPDVAARMAELQAVRGATIVVSDGPSAVRLLTADGGLVMQEPPQRDWRSTRGAGDRLRAALVRGLALGWDWRTNLTAALRDVVPTDEG